MIPRPWLVWLACILACSTRVQALYFYLQAGEQKCFLEDLPNHTIVVGNYKAEEWSDERQAFHMNEALGIQVTVEDLETKEMVVNTRGIPHGKFTFTSHDAGDHQICLRTNASVSWLVSNPRVRLSLDIAIGQSKVDEQDEKDHVHDLAAKVRDLNKRLEDIRNEQQFQREREHEFRSLSEIANSRAVWWSLFQMVVLFATCAWQLRHLRTFFTNKKLV
ncbi:uncharacterized protein L969DRAFT_93900 [Mixia osmundae IAM 14324]|uniref:GOLD domain-containing protein n=1 Tax=Mixia osmundae (strain CBS 9802 / IAM 14324 / JCM 22182 / KY 12970) TaxID=764103 RepID=G7E9X0_MIXOS|nr:uncharacterized protein L969DRAFT_93900 [Mixia osmundae IAM 14324]KEI40073.1 hypothetical protein L969DRAFT_93900 [Mixia osmundae IAM 14324]GAA99439.1 hypothetical protein E5Q_06138 [Mixia osmundae IAM 14324]